MLLILTENYPRIQGAVQKFSIPSRTIVEFLSETLMKNKIQFFPSRALKKKKKEIGIW